MNPNDERRLRRQEAQGCFNLIIAILGAFVIGGFYGWPIGLLSFIIALCALRLVDLAREE